MFSAKFLVLSRFSHFWGQIPGYFWTWTEKIKLFQVPPRNPVESSKSEESQKSMKHYHDLFFLFYLNLYSSNIQFTQHMSRDSKWIAQRVKARERNRKKRIIIYQHVVIFITQPCRKYHASKQEVKSQTKNCIMYIYICIISQLIID